MLYKKWFETNICKRLYDRDADFKVTLHLDKCQHLSFEDAADYTTSLIKHDNKYISFSGGADSEYVVRNFIRNNISFTPIIVNTTLNNTETYYALQVCQQLNLKPIMINIDEQNFISQYISKIWNTIKGIGIWSTPTILAAIYARANDGILITGDQVLDTDRKPGYLEFGEWDFYSDVLFPDIVINYYDYTPELTRSLAQYNISNFDLFKCKVYNVGNRPKSKYKLSNEIERKIAILHQTLMAEPIDFPITKQQFVELT